MTGQRLLLRFRTNGKGSREQELTEQHFRRNPSLCAGNAGSLGEGHPTQLELEQLLKPGLSLLVKRKNIPVMSSLGR